MKALNRPSTYEENSNIKTISFISFFHKKHHQTTTTTTNEVACFEETA
jgi:hypothetical protein